mmetsp:Transcript_22490/g.37201  ORF Transcript_22490/g.37201 Transcript_22490/m.37201 type:complete len:91 (-) Transcript_22490:1061-1333(-)
MIELVRLEESQQPRLGCAGLGKTLLCTDAPSVSFGSQEELALGDVEMPNAVARTAGSSTADVSGKVSSRSPSRPISVGLTPLLHLLRFPR